MLCDRILESAPEDSADDVLDLDWWELDRRALRKTTRGGRDVRVLLPLGVALHDGAILSDADCQFRIAVRAAACEVLVARPRDANEMGVLALELGNLHAPAQVIDGTVRVAPDGPIEAVLSELGIPFERRVAPFCPRRCAGMPEIRISPGFRVAGT